MRMYDTKNCVELNASYCGGYLNLILTKENGLGHVNKEIHTVLSTSEMFALRHYLDVILRDK